jgi:hypothetical protein
LLRRGRRDGTAAQDASHFPPDTEPIVVTVALRIGDSQGNEPLCFGGAVLFRQVFGDLSRVVASVVPLPGPLGIIGWRRCHDGPDGMVKKGCAVVRRLAAKYMACRTGNSERGSRKFHAAAGVCPKQFPKAHVYLSARRNRGIRGEKGKIFHASLTYSRLNCGDELQMKACWGHG